MNMYIKVRNGIAVEHPALESNLLEAFPNGIPSEFEPFERSGVYAGSATSVFQKTISTYIKKENGTWTDVWSIVEMTEEEKQAKTAEITEKANKHISNLKIYANTMIVSCMAASDLNGVNIWTIYLNFVNSWVLIGVDPITPRITEPPFKDYVGNWVQPT